MCEVGAGMSMAAEQLLRNGRSLDRLMITDQSARMIQYSLPFREKGAMLAVADAEKLPFKDDQFDCLVSSVGDPYNKPDFWREVARVLKPQGSVLFTVPAYAWAECFRKEVGGASYAKAEFELLDGRRVLLPSYIYPEAMQEGMIQKSGMIVIERRRVTIGDIRDDNLSPKLCVNRGAEGEIVTGYLICKRSKK